MWRLYIDENSEVFSWQNEYCKKYEFHTEIQMQLGWNHSIDILPVSNSLKKRRKPCHQALISQNPLCWYHFFFLKLSSPVGCLGMNGPPSETTLVTSVSICRNIEIPALHLTAWLSVQLRYNHLIHGCYHINRLISHS